MEYPALKGRLVTTKPAHFWADLTTKPGEDTETAKNQRRKSFFIKPVPTRIILKQRHRINHNCPYLRPDDINEQCDFFISDEPDLYGKS